MNRSVVCLFPGQGSQHVGMGADLYQIYPQARRRFDQANEVLGYNLSRICFEGPAERLNTDLNAQLAIYTVSCILSDLLKQAGIVPNEVAGYSSGYYAAAYTAGGLPFTEGLTTVKLAGEILLDEGRRITGKMAVIFGLPHEKVAAICTQTGEVDVAILNTSQQVIISGHAPAVKQAMEHCLAAGALDAYFLPVETAYHSRFMTAAGKRFLKEIPLAHLSDPQIPIVSYATLDTPMDKKNLALTMASQLASTVRWFDLIRKLSASDPSRFLEVGPGAVISRAVRWIDRTITIVPIGSAKAVERMVANRLARKK